MADFDITGNDAATQFEMHARLDVDEDLIDYDSDDAFVKDPDPKHATNMADTQRLDAHELASETTPALENTSGSIQAFQGAASFPGATSLGVGKLSQPECDGVGQQEQDLDEVSDELDDCAQKTAEKAPTITGTEQACGSIHEIDYEDDGFSFDAPVGGQNQRPSVTSPKDSQGSQASMPLVPKRAGTETPAERYEIDWEDDEEGDGYGAQDEAAQGGAEAAAADAYTDKIGEHDPEAVQESIDQEDEAARPEDSVVAQQAAQPEAFPDITVQYRGEEFPMFSFSSDGFFSDVSILDENMQTVLDGFRAELADEIGPLDDLVFQVDKLGLEFSESSPRDALGDINLRQLLEILDILVKNKDTENSRIMCTYLFTRPNTMKRFEFLVESATGDKGLAEVVYRFQSPVHDNAREDTDAYDGYGEQLDSYESTGDDAAAHTSHGSANAYEDAALLDGGNAHSINYQDEHHVGRDGDAIDASTGDKTTSADDDENTQNAGPADADPGTSHENGATEYNIGDAFDDNGHGGVSEPFYNEPVAIDKDEYLLGTLTGGGRDGSDANTRPGPCGQRIFDHHLDPDLIDYSSAGDKNVGDDDDLLANFPDNGNGNVENLASKLVKDETGDNKAVADDEDLIDYESVGGDNEGAQHGAEYAHQTSREDTSDDEGEGSAHGNLGHYVGYDGDLIDYSADSSGDKHDAADGASANPEVGNDGQATLDGLQVATGDDIESGGSLAFTGGPAPSLIASDAHAHVEGATESLLDVDLDELDAAKWERTQVSASAGHRHLAEAGRDTLGMIGSGTTATLGENGDAVSDLGDFATGSYSSGNRAEPVAAGLQDNLVGGAADTQSNLMKRAHPGDVDGGNGNGKRRKPGSNSGPWLTEIDVKRRRS